MIWKVQEMHSSKKNLSEMNIICEKHFIETYNRDQGHFIISISFKPNFENLLGETREFTVNRFCSQARRLLKNHILNEECTISGNIIDYFGA